MEQNQNESILSQDEADRLIAIGKIIIGSESFKMPTFGDEKKIISLEDTQAVTSFRVDIQFSRRSNSLKGNYQLCVHSNVPLLRLNFNGPSHSNPDGSKVGGNHLHTKRKVKKIDGLMNLQEKALVSSTVPQESCKNF